MREFKSKLALNHSLLEKNKEIKEGEIVAIKTYSNCTGEHEATYILKKCKDCPNLFFQSLSPRVKYLYQRCERCSKVHAGGAFNGKN